MIGYETQLGLFFLIGGLASFLTGGAALILHSRTNQLLPWNWLGMFAICRGLYEFLSLPMVRQVMSGHSEIIRLALLFFSVIFLLEFARGGSFTSEGLIPRRWIYLSLAGIVVLLGLLVGLPDLFDTAHFYVSLLAGLWAAWVIFKAGPRFPKGNEYFTGAGVIMALYTLTACIVDSPSSSASLSSLISRFFLTGLGVPIQLIRGSLAIGLAICLCRLCQLAMAKIMDRRSQMIYRHLTSGTLIGLIFVGIVGLVGSFGTNYLGGKASRDVVTANEKTAQRIKEIINQEMEKADRLVQLLAGSLRVHDLLNKNDLTTVNAASEILDRYSQIEEGFSVCYVMDLKGTTMASSNRNQPDSFVGKNYSFRPYFKQAALGLQGRYFALGVTSKELGYYTSCPVRNLRGAILGVVVIKRSIKTVGELKSSFAPGSSTFLTDPQGIVVLSNQAKNVLHSLWPLEEDTQKQVIASGQFGPGPFPAILDQKPLEGTEYQLAGQRTIALAQPILMEGWTLFHFGSIQGIALYQMLGMGVLMVFGLALIGFYVWWDGNSYKTAGIAATETSREGFVDQGEQKYRALGSNLSLLNEMKDLLQGCKSLPEAAPVIYRYMHRLFPDLSGGLYLPANPGHTFEVFGVWGDFPPKERTFTQDDCWAVRRGRPYQVEDTGASLLCHHLPEGLSTGYQCFPIVAQGETLGLFHLRRGQYLDSPSDTLSETQRQVDQQLLTTVVDQIGLTLVNLKLREPSPA